MANKQDEAYVLASLGSTTAVASHYESSVLRNAQLSTAPQIVLPQSVFYNDAASSNTSSVRCKDSLTFPKLSSLAPSTDHNGATNASADIPHVLRVLSRVRDSLSSTQCKPLTAYDGNESQKQTQKRREIDLLAMKEQILLDYLTTVAGLNEKDEVIPQRRNRKRPREVNPSEVYYGPLNGRESAADSDVKNINKCRTTLPSNTLEPSTNRLDRIKNGEHVDSNIENNTPRGRRTMMQMKSDMRMRSGLTPLKSMEEERFDKERSRKRREERRKRRIMKQRAALGLDNEIDEVEYDDSTKKEATEVVSVLKTKQKDALDGALIKIDAESSMKNKVCWDKDVYESENTPKKNGVYWDQTVQDITATAHKNKSNLRASPVKRTHTKVMCPVCQIILTCEEEDGAPDEFLSKHIEQCQQSRSRGDRTLRRRIKPANIRMENGHADSFNNEASNAEVPLTDYESFIGNDIDDNESAQKVPDYDPKKFIDDIDEFDYEDRVDDWIENGIDRMKDMSERDSNEVPPGTVTFDGGLEVPAWINDRLFPYQRTGVRWMWELYCQSTGGVVGDEMGLGKTVQVAAFVGTMAANRCLDSVLIIAPATMLSHWLSELAVWAPGLRRVLVHRSGEADGLSRVASKGMLRSLKTWLKKARADRVNEALDDRDFDEQGVNAFCGTGYAIVTTYESIRKSPEIWTDHDWSYVVLDEGQKIRNPDADITLACKRLRTTNRLLISGTPIQNNLRELWSLFDFIFPGKLGTLPAFEAEFAEPIKRGGYSNASPMQVQLAYRCALVLRDLINPYLLRRQKKDIKEVNRMPGKTEQVLFCRLSSKQRSLYKEYLASDEVMGVMRGSVQLLKAITMLRKICNHPNLVVGPDGALDSAFQEESSDDDDFDVSEEDKLAERAGKLHVLSKILPLWKEQGHKVIIFCQWRKMLNIVERFVRQEGWKFARLDGNTNVASRQKIVDKFNQDESFFVMLMTTRTGGIGLNVTGANRVLLYDPDWNPQTDAQARERAWRFGQKKDVTVYRLITAGTIEEKIYQRQIFKTAITNQILQDPKQRRLFSQKDLKDLFTLKDDSTDSTETGKITRGQGVVDVDEYDPNASLDKDKVQSQNGDTLEIVMKSKGLCGVFDHSFVESSSAKKKPSVLEMEENAKKIALKAASTLKSSTGNADQFSPTWTGSEETLSSRPNSALGTGSMPSSSSMLAHLRNKRMEISVADAPCADTNSSSVSADKKYSALLSRLRKYIKHKNSRGNGPTTKELLNEFKDVPDSDAAIFRSMLKSVASVKKGHWIMQ